MRVCAAGYLGDFSLQRLRVFELIQVFRKDLELHVPSILTSVEETIQKLYDGLRTDMD